MKKNLHKRLEEAALKISCVCPSSGQFGTGDYEPAEFDEDMYKSALLGAEWGYKEAIKVAKEWLSKQTSWDYYDDKPCKLMTKEMLADFENDMNKLFKEN